LKENEVKPVLTALIGSALILPFATAVAAPADTAHAVLRDASGTQRAEASFAQTKQGVKVTLKATALSAGTYGTHVHAVGRCEAPDYRTSGGHWNPLEKQHGKDNPKGMHMGDLPNLVVDAKGKGEIDFVIPAAVLHGGDNPLLDADGASIIVHTGPDDYATDPAGNSGGRMACGVIG
jgi:Cu-Zn family superoxide dismutase